jgi:hypothetical protein
MKRNRKLKQYRKIITIILEILSKTIEITINFVYDVFRFVGYNLILKSRTHGANDSNVLLM